LILVEKDNAVLILLAYLIVLAIEFVYILPILPRYNLFIQSVSNLF